VPRVARRSHRARHALHDPPRRSEIPLNSRDSRGNPEPLRWGVCEHATCAEARADRRRSPAV
jgi:hypothetical protein